MNVRPLLTERRGFEPGVRENAVALLLGSLDERTTRPEARAKLATLASLYRWNAETQGACLRALRTRYDDAR